MNKPDTDKPASTRDQLIGADAIAANQMSDQELDNIAGGAAVDVTQNQPKGAIKSAEANDALMRM